MAPHSLFLLFRVGRVSKHTCRSPQSFQTSHMFCSFFRFLGGASKKLRHNINSWHQVSLFCVLRRPRKQKHLPFTPEVSDVSYVLLIFKIPWWRKQKITKYHLLTFRGGRVSKSKRNNDEDDDEDDGEDDDVYIYTCIYIYT